MGVGLTRFSLTPFFTKNMKRISFLLAILISALVFTSCEDRYVTNLKKQVKIANASCPINYGIGGDLLSMKYDEKGNQVLMYFSVNEDIAGGIFLLEDGIVG